MSSVGLALCGLDENSTEAQLLKSAAKRLDKVLNPVQHECPCCHRMYSRPVNGICNLCKAVETSREQYTDTSENTD